MDEATEGLNELVTWSGEFNTTSANIAGYIAATILGVSLIFVVWALATNKQNAKTYLIAWFIAVVFTVLFII